MRLPHSVSGESDASRYIETNKQLINYLLIGDDNHSGFL